MASAKALPDRRIVRTREALRGALVELILEKGYDAITVNDIVTRANVARSTFYAHHGSKESVLLDGFGGLRDFLARAQRNAQEAAHGVVDPLGFSLAFFEHADESRDLSRALLGSGGGISHDQCLEANVRPVTPTRFDRGGGSQTKGIIDAS